MSRKGVITKRVKTVQTALSRISAQPRSPAGRGTNVPRSAKTVSVRLKSRPKSKPPADHASRPGKHARGRPSKLTPRRARPSARAGNKPRGRATVRVPRPMHPSEPGKNVPRPAENSAKSHPLRPRRPTVNPSGHDRSDSATTRLSGRSSRRPSQRRGRPEALLKPNLYFQARLNPKPPLERPSTIYIAF
ncbi:unnamed protein product [Microthlaspi erraticum]|uniref:Uncharacterized protein n=1 Tax=Microthlaspi erraticum TaxID=1685480 RepID=A0A6D2JRS7_9BRAS|nr:unnamed protein product [Microthlaspi erraticum]